MNRRMLLAAGGSALASSKWTAAQVNVDRQDIVIGQSIVRTGPLAGSVTPFVAGAELAIQAQNKAGGLQGRRLRLQVLDDTLSGSVAADNFRALVQDHKALALFGAFGTQTVSAALPVLRESGVPLIGNFSVADPVREELRGHAYFVRADYHREAQAVIRHLRTLSIERIAVAHFAGPGAEGVLKPIREELARDKLDIVAAAPVKNDSSNVAEAAAQLAGRKPQAVILFLGGPAVPNLLKALGQAGVAPNYYGLSSVSGELVAQALGPALPGLVIAQVVPYPWADADPVARAFRALAQAAGQPVNYASFEGYLNALVLLEALRRCGRDLTPLQLHKVMKTMNLRLGNLGLDYRADGVTGSRFVELVRVAAGGRFIK